MPSTFIEPRYRSAMRPSQILNSLLNYNKLIKWKFHSPKFVIVFLDFPELSEDNTVGEFNSDVGKLVSAILTHCHGNADLSSSAIDESLSEVCVEALKQSSELLRACIMALGDIGEC